MASGETERAAIAEQAADWLVSLDAGRADPEAFEHWRNADPRHAAIFAQTAATWQKTGILRGSGIDIPTVAEVPPPPRVDMRPPLLRRRTVLTGMAASVATVAVGIGFFANSRPADAETGVGERRTIRLPNGGRAELNTSSRIAWRLGDQLDLWLEEGEVALFTTARSIRAYVAGVEARLLDGRYNLRLDDQRPALITVAGAAYGIGPDGRSIMVRPGQTLREGAGGLMTQTLDAEQMDRALAWQRGEIVFDGMTLANAVGEFNRYLPRRIRLADPAIANLRLGGRYNSDDPQGFLQALQDGFGIASRIEGEEILLYRQQS